MVDIRTKKKKQFDRIFFYFFFLSFFSLTPTFDPFLNFSRYILRNVTNKLYTLFSRYFTSFFNIFQTFFFFFLRTLFSTIPIFSYLLFIYIYIYICFSSLSKCFYFPRLQTFSYTLRIRFNIEPVLFPPNFSTMRYF